MRVGRQTRQILEKLKSDTNRARRGIDSRPVESGGSYMFTWIAAVEGAASCVGLR